MKLKLIILSLLPYAIFAQISMVSSGNYSQNFDALLPTGSVNTWEDNVTIPSIFAQRTGFGTTYQAGTGSSTVGNLYSFGASGSSDRALGSLGSDNTSALNFAFGVLLQNNSGFVLNELNVTYTLEQWRNGGNTTPDEVTVWYKVSNSLISSLTPSDNSGWIPIPLLTAASPINTTSTGALDGNLPANRVTLSNISLPNLSVSAGHYVMIKWEDPNHAGNDDGLGIDDLQIAWNVGCNTSNSIAVTACNSYTVPSGDETYFSSGIYSDTLPNATLCDSILTIDLTIQTSSIYYADQDNDGFGDANNSIDVCTPPSTGYVTNGNDCNDQDNSIGIGTTIFYLDADLDGYGNPTSTILGCVLPTGYSLNGLDCNDSDNTIHPTATDLPDNGIDEDCSGSDASVIGSSLGKYEFTQTAACPMTAMSVTTQPANALFSDFTTSGTNCSAAANVLSTSGWNTTNTINLDEYSQFSIEANPCFALDLNQLIFTHRISGTGGSPTWIVRSSLDNFISDLGTGTSFTTDKTDTIHLLASMDLVSQVTFRFYLINMGTSVSTWRKDNISLVGNELSVQPVLFYADSDGDSFGNPLETVLACAVPAGYVADNTDCNDSDSLINPTTVWYLDADADNVGNAQITFVGCIAPSNYVLIAGDCDDADAALIYPMMYYEDNDNDGFGAGTGIEFCANPGAGYAMNNNDCDDSQPSVYPGAPELCDGFDNNCNGETNEGLPTTIYYYDNDGDTFGQGVAGDFCANPGAGYVSNNLDCNDANPGIYPSAPEILNNGIDENCDNTDNYAALSESKLDGFKVFPNPSNGSFYVVFPIEMKSVNAQLIDLSGKELRNFQLQESHEQVDFSAVEAGIYIFKLTTETGTYCTQLVID